AGAGILSLTRVHIWVNNYHFLSETLGYHMVNNVVCLPAVYHRCLVAEDSVQDIKNRVLLVLIIADRKLNLCGSVLLNCLGIVGDVNYFACLALLGGILIAVVRHIGLNLGAVHKFLGYLEGAPCIHYFIFLVICIFACAQRQ